jgi:hypothetical protein
MKIIIALAFAFLLSSPCVANTPVHGGETNSARSGGQTAPGAAVAKSPPRVSKADPQLRTAEDPTVLVKVETDKSSDDTGGWKAFLNWIFGWQFLILLIVAYLLFCRKAPDVIRRLFAPFGSVKLFGAEFVINRVAGEDAEETINLLRNDVTNRFDGWVAQNDIAGIHRKIVDVAIGPSVDLQATEIRSTIYVSDLLFADTLYQLLDYYPFAPGPHGRVFSTRFGIIGKAWRLRESQYKPFVPERERDLILEWGMTYAEAPSAGHGRESFGCIVLKGKSGDALGLLYVDSPQKDVFGVSEISEEWVEIERRVQAMAEKEGLLGKLESLNRSLISRSAQINIYHASTSIKSR